MKIAIFQFSMFGINTYIVYDPDTLCCAIIDPGMSDKNEESAIDTFIQKHNLNVTCVINTHLHIDHAVGDSYIKNKYHVPVLANLLDEPLGLKIGQQASMFGIYGKFDDVIISEYINAGKIIKIGNGRLSVIHVPGHSPGSVALYDRQDGFVIVGDALFKGSIGRTDLPGGDYRQLIESINSQLLSLPDSTVVYPGHGPSTTIGDEKCLNPYL